MPLIVRPPPRSSSFSGITGYFKTGNARSTKNVFYANNIINGTRWTIADVPPLSGQGGTFGPQVNANGT